MCVCVCTCVCVCVCVCVFVCVYVCPPPTVTPPFGPEQVTSDALITQLRRK